jgi:hypothetical protein
MGNKNSTVQVGLDGQVDVESQSPGISSYFPTNPFASPEPEEDEMGMGKFCGSTFELSYTTRLRCFVLCFGLGCVLSLMSSFTLLNPTKFAITYSIGNLLSVLSTGFLVGPKRQMSYACAPVRVVAFSIFIASFGATLISAFVIKKALVTLIFVIVQIIAGLWYSASYIPYGREILTKCGQTLLGRAQAQVT